MYSVTPHHHHHSKACGSCQFIFILLGAAVKFCARRAQTLFTSHSGHMLTGLNLGPESGFKINLLWELGLCYLSRDLAIQDIGQRV